MARVVTTIVSGDEVVRQDHEINQDFAVIVHNQGIKVDVPDFVEINGQNTIECIDKMNQKQWEWISTGELFKHLWEKSFNPRDVTELPKSIEIFKLSDLGQKHVAGMIILGCEALFASRSIFIRNPETHLHPATERYIMGMFYEMMKLCGKNGVITKEINDIENKLNKAVEEVGREPFSPEENKKQTLKWLQCMDENKKFAQYGDKIFTVLDLIAEVVNDTESGQQFINKYVELRDNGK